MVPLPLQVLMAEMERLKAEACAKYMEATREVGGVVCRDDVSQKEAAALVAPPLRCHCVSLCVARARAPRRLPRRAAALELRGVDLGDAP